MDWCAAYKNGEGKKKHNIKHKPGFDFIYYILLFLTFAISPLSITSNHRTYTRHRHRNGKTKEKSTRLYGFVCVNLTIARLYIFFYKCPGYYNDLSSHDVHLFIFFFLVFVLSTSIHISHDHSIKQNG